MLRFCVKVYGCQMNAVDGDRLKTVFVSNGWEFAGEEEADLVFLVTCSIREKAEQKILSEIGRFGKRWRKTGRPIVAVVGCMAQRIGTGLFSRYPWVRLLAGPRSLGRVPEVADQLFSETGRFALLDEDPISVTDLETPGLVRANKWRAYVTITHGCDNFCTYCIVPFVRGRFQSRPAEAILRDVKALVSDGALDVTLLGQNVNSYGQDLPGGPSFSKLLAQVAEVEGLARLRFVTSHPKDFSRDIVMEMIRNPVICPSVNLPLQSGSDRILARMNRGYTLAEYAEKVEWIRQAFPEAGLTSDLIVGFPGESEKDFEESLSALRFFRYDLVHTAAYSRRPPSKAAEMEDQVDPLVKSLRLNAANALQREIALSINRSLEGKTVEVLFEGPADKGEGLIAGRTVSDKVVLARGTAREFGRIRKVRIERGDAWSLFGVIL
ncbi:MAG: tRNA (N6-isopentenyl adenosine(37)-C2)-methylthiotransferase MiaB [Synergistaceae bacterium]|nr:tRNA (N6-isopentenyl adenosine(37)-C2)-methylthiotransferase MiaB [Synergistaceae bacterium]